MHTGAKMILKNSENDIYFPLISTPFGKVPLIAATMTDEREREIARKYPAKVAGKAV